jgi:hypothetical protein
LLSFKEEIQIIRFRSVVTLSEIALLIWFVLVTAKTNEKGVSMILPVKGTRSKFGKWMDAQKDLNRFELERASNISRSTIGKLCRDPGYRPRFSTIIQINRALKSLGKNIDINDFFA